jgi:hypothetical protein
MKNNSNQIRYGRYTRIIDHDAHAPWIKLVRTVHTLKSAQIESAGAKETFDSSQRMLLLSSS